MLYTALFGFGLLAFYNACVAAIVGLALKFAGYDFNISFLIVFIIVAVIEIVTSK